MTLLIEKFEQENYPVAMDSSPRKNLEALTEHCGITQADLARVLGSRSLAAEILNGKRSIGKAAAKKLAQLFRVPIDLLIDS